MAVSLFLLVRPYFPAAVTAYVSLWFMKWSHVIHPGDWLMTSWGIAVAIVLVIDMMQPRRLARCTNGMTYIGIGALVGMMVGMTGFFLSVDGGRCCHRGDWRRICLRTHPGRETSRISFGSIFSVSLCQRAAGCSDSVDYRYRGDAMDYRTASGCHHSVHVAGFCILRQHTCIILNYIRL